MYLSENLTIYLSKNLSTHNPSPTFSNCCPTFQYSEFQGITEGFVFGDSIQFLTSFIQCILKRPYTSQTLFLYRQQ